MCACITFLFILVMVVKLGSFSKFFLMTWERISARILAGRLRSRHQKEVFDIVEKDVSYEQIYPVLGRHPIVDIVIGMGDLNNKEEEVFRNSCPFSICIPVNTVSASKILTGRCDSAVVQKCKIFSCCTNDINLPENIDDHWIAIKSVFIFGPSEKDVARPDLVRKSRSGSIIVKS